MPGRTFPGWRVEKVDQKVDHGSQSRGDSLAPLENDGDVIGVRSVPTQNFDQ
jgi:hypothetical protein